MNFLDLFSGIGGFALGLERAGHKTVAFCEIDPFCQKILKKQWPEIPRYCDIRELSARQLLADGIAVDAICGGFPCQDISLAGDRRGIGGTRSILWTEYARLIGEIRPIHVIVENVPGLLSLGFGDVLGDLAALGYDAEWHCIPASAVGAPHIRDRVWIVAYPAAERWEEDEYPISPPAFSGSLARQLARSSAELRGNWEPESDLGRVAHGLPHRVDRVGCLGNAVIPQIPEIIGRALND